MEANGIDDETLQRCRAYLKVLAAGQVDPWLSQRMDASDLVQQTLLDATTRWHQYRGASEGELFAWLRAILSHNLIDAFRHHCRAKRDATKSVSLDDENSQSVRRIEALGDSVSSPSERAARNEQLLRLPEAINALPDAQREAIILHHLQGRKLAETARAMGRSEAAIGGLLQRGLKRLHELLEE